MRAPRPQCPGAAQWAGAGWSSYSGSPSPGLSAAAQTGLWGVKGPRLREAKTQPALVLEGEHEVWVGDGEWGRLRWTCSWCSRTTEVLGPVTLIHLAKIGVLSPEVP